MRIFVLCSIENIESFSKGRTFDTEQLITLVGQFGTIADGINNADLMIVIRAGPREYAEELSIAEKINLKCEIFNPMVDRDLKEKIKSFLKKIRINEITRNEADSISKKLSKGEIGHTHPDVSLARQKFGFLFGSMAAPKRKYDAMDLRLPGSFESRLRR